MALAFLPACEEYLDVNNDPTRLNDASLSLLLPTTIEALSSTHYSMAYSASQAAHQMGAFNGYYGEFTNSGAWSTIYLKGLNNLDALEKKAATTEGEYSPHYEGIAKVLKAMYVGLLTTSWENVPYTEALQGSDNVLPTYDSQESLYAEIQNLLDAGISLLEKGESFHVPASDDLIYGGDITKWIKLAHSLKARYMIHLSNKASIDYNAILTQVNLGLASNEDNFMLYYNSANTNPWFTNVAKANETGNFSVTHTGYFIKTLLGEWNGGIMDPRLPLLAYKDAEDDYIGEEAWNENAPESTVLLTKDTWHSTEGAPILMMTYSELKFIEAEAALNVDATRAGTAYMEGISSNMDMLGVSDADKMAYMGEAAISTVNLSNVMMQKWIAQFLHCENWVDMRRMHYDDSIYIGFVEPDYLDRNEPGQRARYPSTEEDRNNANVVANRKDFTTPMWFVQ